MDHSSLQSLESAGARNAVHELALSRLFSRLWEVSALPKLAMQLLMIHPHDDDSIETLLPIIEGDSVIAARVLRRVNSLSFGFSEEIRTLAEAAGRLSVQELRNFALTASLARLYSFGELAAKASGYPRDELWTSGVAVAMTADLVAQRGGCVARHSAYAAGLLHDIGYLLLDQHLQSHYLRFVALARHRAREASQWTDLEEQIFTFNHASLGGFVASHWGVPDPLCDAIEFHHRFEQYTGDHRSLLATVVVADSLCAELDWTPLGLSCRNNHLDAALDSANVSPEVVEEIRRELPELLAQVPAAAALR